jgi:murein DD-endopeptidase
MRTVAAFVVVFGVTACSPASPPVASPAAPATSAAPVLVAAPAPASPAADPAKVEGQWKGVLNEQLHLGLTLSYSKNGFEGVLDSVDQGAKLPIDRIQFDGRALRFEISRVEGVFEGTLNEHSSEISGTWTQKGSRSPLAFSRGAAEKAPVSPPLDAPIDVAAIAPPYVHHADDGTFLVYELTVTNLFSEEISLQQIAVTGGGNSLADVKGTDLVAACGRTGADTSIAAGRRVVVFMWMRSGDKVPTALEHRIVVKARGKDYEVSKLQVPVRQPARLTIGPPLRGQWWLSANGPSATSGHRRAVIPVAGHAGVPQRFAIDWVKVDDSGKTYRGDPGKNANYQAYGAEALAVANGVVTEVKDGIPENNPGPNRAVPITLETIGGNHVIIDLGGGHFAFYAHFQPGSLRVKLGDRVKRGQVLGLVGNSGNSTEPHLHFHVSDANSPLATEGIPYVFDAFELRGDDKSVSKRKGQMPGENKVIGFP